MTKKKGFTPIELLVVVAGGRCAAPGNEAKGFVVAATRRESFTLIELLVVVAIIAVLVSVLLPALSSAQQSARSAICQSNLKQIGLGIVMYAEDNNDRLTRIYGLDSGSVPRWYYFWQLRDYVGDDLRYFDCPTGLANLKGQTFSDSLPNPPVYGSDYGINERFEYSRHYRLSKLEKAWGYLGDSRNPDTFVGKWNFKYQQVRLCHWLVDGWQYLGSFASRHHGGCNVLFTDFHVEWGPFEHWLSNHGVFGDPSGYIPY